MDTLIFRPLKDWYFAKADIFYLLAGHDEQASRVNLLNPGSRTLAITGTWTASTGFVVDRGWTTVTQATDYLNPGISMNTAGLKYVQNSAHFAIWSRTDNKAPATRSYDMGDNNGNGAIGRSDNGAGQIYLKPNVAASIDPGGGYYPGPVGWSRTASNAWASYGGFSGVALHSGADASTAVGTGVIRIFNVAGSGSYNQLAAASLGSTLTAAEMLALFVANNNYFKAIGAA